FWPQGIAYPQGLKNIGTAAPIGFIFLLLGGFVYLLRCNSILRHAIIPANYAGSPVKSQPESLVVPEEGGGSLAVKQNEENKEYGDHQLSD
ncbi:MAG: hypothetical protein MUO62_18700, partial [Anaerolineales bacterium]|nr:hypothetical protein [Anaerolineales bacterium]